MNSNKKSRVIPLTPRMLRKMIAEESGKGFGPAVDTEKRAKDTEETDADEFADTVDNAVDWKKANHIKESDTLDEHINMMRGLKLEEARLVRRLSVVRRALSEGAQKLVTAKVI